MGKVDEIVSKDNFKWAVRDSLNEYGVAGVFERTYYPQVNKEKYTGHQTQGKVYMPFRYYTTQFGMGWVNAYLVMELSKTSVKIVSISYYKAIEKPIKIGEV
ncbi:MAG: hypothetical protein MUE53_09560 [Chitinophagales bacterium]|nr:hypothetical protein [Chitinophagales bacterium]